MSARANRMSVELFTSSSRILGQIRTRHIHVRDELNDATRSLLIFDQMEVASLNDLRGHRLVSKNAWLSKSLVLLAVPSKIKGTTSVLTQRSIRDKLGKNEHRILADISPFRVLGDLYFAGQFRAEDALRREGVPFASLLRAEVAFLPDPGVSFALDEVVLNTEAVEMLCTDFVTT